MKFAIGLTLGGFQFNFSPYKGRVVLPRWVRLVSLYGDTIAQAQLEEDGSFAFPLFDGGGGPWGIWVLAGNRVCDFRMLTRLDSKTEIKLEANCRDTSMPGEAGRR
jgi:hypothetical protein